MNKFKTYSDKYITNLKAKTVKATNQISTNDSGYNNYSVTPVITKKPIY